MSVHLIQHAGISPASRVAKGEVAVVEDIMLRSLVPSRFLIP
jgi:hypothetical protein